MERTTFTTFAGLAERAARYPTVIRRSQMRKTMYVTAVAAADCTPREAESYA